MNCKKCQEQLSEGAKFCKSCGQNQEEANETIQNETVTTNCKKCQKQLSEGAKFCKSCGQNQEEPVQNIEQTPVQQVSEQVNEQVNIAPKVKKANKKTPAIMVGVGAVLVIGVGATSIALNTPQAKILRAFQSTSDQITKQVEKYQQELPVISYLKDIAKTPYTVEFELEGTENIVTTDISKKQMEVSNKAYGVNTNVLISEKLITIENSLLNDVVGIELDKLIEEINNSEYIDIDVSKNANVDIFEVYEFQEKLLGVVNSSIKSRATELAKAIEIEEEEKENIKIDGQTEKSDKYLIQINAKEIEKAYENIIEDVFSDSYIEEELEQYLESFNTFMEMSEGYNPNIDTDDLKYIFEELLEEVIYGIEMIEDLDKYLYIYDGKIVKLLVESRDFEASISLGSVDNLLKEVCVEIDEYDYGKGEITFGLEFEDGVFEFEMRAYDESLVFEYDTLGKSDNVQIKIPGWGSLEGTINSTEKNKLIIELGDLEMEIEKNHLSNNWFNQPSKYANLFNYDELEDLIY